MAHSRLYRNEILRENPHFSAFFELYRILGINFRNSAKFHKFELFSGKIAQLSLEEMVQQEMAQLAEHNVD